MEIQPKNGNHFVECNVKDILAAKNNTILPLNETTTFRTLFTWEFTPGSHLHINGWLFCPLLANIYFLQFGMTSIFQTEKYFLVTTWILVSHGGRGKKDFVINNSHETRSCETTFFWCYAIGSMEGGRKNSGTGDVPFKKETLKATNVLFCICAFKFFN